MSNLSAVSSVLIFEIVARRWRSPRLFCSFEDSTGGGHDAELSTWCGDHRYWSRTESPKAPCAELRLDECGAGSRKGRADTTMRKGNEGQFNWAQQEWASS